MVTKKGEMVTIDENTENKFEKDILKSMLKTVFNNNLIDRNIFNKVMTDINRL